MAPSPSGHSTPRRTSDGPVRSFGAGSECSLVSPLGQGCEKLGVALEVSIPEVLVLDALMCRFAESGREVGIFPEPPGVGAAYRDLPVAGASAAAPPVVLSGRGSVRPYDHDGAAGVFGKVLTDRPEEQTSEAPSAPRSDDDHVRSLVIVEEP